MTAGPPSPERGVTHHMRMEVSIVQTDNGKYNAAAARDSRPTPEYRVIGSDSPETALRALADEIEADQAAEPDP